MRCPHCGYNSFSHLSRCKKCGEELHEINTHTCPFEDSGLAQKIPADAVSAPEVIPSPEAELETISVFKVKSEAEVEAETNISLSRSAVVLTAGDFSLNLDSEASEVSQEPDTNISQSTTDVHSSMVMRRFIASAVDMAAILGVWFLFYVLEYKLIWGPHSQFFAPLLSSPRIRGGFYLLFVLIALGYYNIFHYVNGQTPGKILTRVRVVSIDREPLSLAQVLLRTCGGFISALCLGCGYMVIWFSSSKRGWNDLLADTEVVSSTETVMED